MTIRFNADHPVELPAAQRPREIPILFHLRDVRQCRSAAEGDAASCEAPAETALSGAESQGNASCSTSVAAPVTVAAATTLPVAVVDAKAAVELKAAAPEPITEAISPVASETPKEPEEAQKVSLARGRKPVTTTDHWFVSQGKYIAIGFAVALLGTVIYSHATRPTAPGNGPQAVHSFPGDAGLPAVQESPNAGLVKAPATPNTVAFVGATSEVVPAKPAEAAAAVTEPKTELHAPVAAQIANGTPAGTQPKTDESLFPWAKKAEERVASRPAGPAYIENPAMTNANDRATGFSQTANPPEIAPPALPPVAQATAPEPAYPTTAARSAYPPVGGPAPVAAPNFAGQMPNQNAGNRSAYVPSAGGPPTAGYPAAPVGAATQPYTTPENTARGPRYDRTGSGIY
jgi:hypothetical protein